MSEKQKAPTHPPRPFADREIPNPNGSFPRLIPEVDGVNEAALDPSRFRTAARFSAPTPERDFE
jgi:hypothetical protein